MKWKKPARRLNKNSTISLPDLVEWLNENAEKKAGNWMYSHRFAELMVAEALGQLPPSKWDNYSQDDKEEMFAFWKNKQEMLRWEQYMQDAEIEKRQRKKNKFSKYGR